MRHPSTHDPAGHGDRSDQHMAEIRAELEELIRMGLVAVDSDGGLLVTDAGTAAINAANAQTWN